MTESTRIEVLFTPNEFSALTPERLQDTVCVVFDVLRATTSMVTALAHGARSICPVSTVAQAVAFKHRHPEAWLGGERHGWRITAKASGGIDFDLGNSPAEFTSPGIQNRILAVTTTNGTRALIAASPARLTFVSSFLNLNATAKALRSLKPASLLLIGAGTYEEAALEDTLAAGALCDALWDLYGPGHVADSALMARLLYQRLGAGNLAAALAQSLNGRRLMQLPGLSQDVAFAAQLDAFPLVAKLDADGLIRRESDLNAGTG